MKRGGSYVPARGDAVWITLDPQAGRRPALVLSPSAYMVADVDGLVIEVWQSQSESGGGI